MKTSDIEVSYIQHCGDDLSVVNAARVSFHKESEWTSGEEIDTNIGVTYEKYLHPSDEKLIKYLATHRHFSPFNHSFITLRVKAPIYCFRQLVKHKFMPINEVSRRYVDEEPEFYFPESYRQRADNIKQGSSDNDSRYSPEEAKEFTEIALAEYIRRIKAGVAPEQARDCLPLNMMSEIWWSGTLGAYCDMLRLRLDPHTQFESRIVANKVKEIIQPLFPVSLNALLEVK